MTNISEPPQAASRRGSKLIALVLLIVGCGGAAVGAYVWLAGPVVFGEPSPSSAPQEVTGSGVIPLDPFLVNLTDVEAPRFFRVSLRLVVRDAKTATQVVQDEVRLLRVRSAILELLSAQRSDRLVTADGKAELKAAIADRASVVLGNIQVLDVLFSDFVVQF